jgi:hypothetical protein
VIEVYVSQEQVVDVLAVDAEPDSASRMNGAAGAAPVVDDRGAVAVHDDVARGEARRT